MKWFKKLCVFAMGVLVLAALGVALYVWRSMPSLGGSLHAPGLGQSVSVQRDTSDVTHIMAQSPIDAAYALGYVHAQERSWQLEFNRRLMHGELSEFLGAATLDTDKLMRSLGIIRAAKAQLDGLPADAKAILDAYARGINSFHAANLGLSGQALPPEFPILGIKPGQWTPEDSVGWGIMMALDLGGNWGVEFARLSAAQKVGTAQLWQLFPAYPGEAPATKLDLAKLYADLGVYRTQANSAQASSAQASSPQASSPQAVAKLVATTQFASIQPDNTQITGATNSIADRAYSVLARGIFNPLNILQTALLSTEGMQLDAQQFGQNMGNVEGKGSNNWVVAGSKTTSGKPLLANDPHLGLSAPAIWYFARLQVKAADAAAPESDVIGATLPGLPGVILGRTAKVAWGFTNTGPDVQDLYLEQINPANPLQYRLPKPDGDTALEQVKLWQNFDVREETIRVKGQVDVAYTVRSTRHGPVISDAQPTHADVLDLKKYVIALRWSGLDADNRTLLAGFKAQKAQSVGELFAAYADYHSPMQNVVAADVSGTIAYKAVGRVPVRRADNDIKGIAPAPGWEAKYDWAGWIPYNQTPQDYGDGKKGWVATANQRIHAADYPHFLGADWTTPQRFDRIEALLAAQPQHDMASMQAIQADTFSTATQLLVPWLRSTTSSHALAATALAHLHHFDGQMDADSPAPLIFAAWADEFTRGLIAPKLGEAKFKTLYGKRHFRGTLEQVVQNNDRFWCAPKTCAEQSGDALGRALDRLQADYGSDVSEWRWGRAHMARSVHKPFGNIPVLAKVFDVAVPTGGDPWTVNVGQYWANEKQPFNNRHAASLRAVYDLANLDNSQFIYQTGQSGLVFSSRYRNMGKEWGANQYRPLQMQPAGFVHSQTLLP